MTYKIYTLGCKANQYDSTQLKRKLGVIGGEEVVSNADLAIINTCAVTKTAMNKAGRIIHKARVESPGAFIVVLGCFIKLKKSTASELGVDLVWGVGEPGKLANIIKKRLNLPSRKTKELTASRKKTFERSRYTIKIQDGCEQFCSYCIVPFTRGKLNSRAPEKVLREIKQAISEGYEEIVLSGIHLGLYGADLGDIDLVDLLKQILALPGLGRVRLSSIEITEVSDKLIGLMKNNHKLCPHLSVPLQSGGDKILKLMNRPYTAHDFRTKINQIRQAIPDIAITTDVIVGFPLEREEDFNATCELVKELKFSRLHVFPYSRHKETKSANLKPQISREEKLRRARTLRQIGGDLEREYQAKFEGQPLNVVIEKESGSQLKGRSEYYFNISFNESQIITGENRPGKIVKISPKT